MNKSDRAGKVFCFDLKATVHVPLEVAYICRRKIESFDEFYEQYGFQDPVNVFVDAVLSDNVWVATLMWTGERPPRPHVNDSENVFREGLRLVANNTSTGNACSLKAVDLVNSNISDVFAKFRSPADTDLPVLAYPNSKGIIISVCYRSALCKVREPEGYRSVEFTRFYRDGKMHMGPLDKGLRKNDTIYVDYLVGTTSFGTEEVLCRLAWQGNRPRMFVHQLTPGEFSQQMDREAQMRSSCLPKVQSLPSEASHSKQRSQMLPPFSRLVVDMQKEAAA